ncbi:beta strand repeat-containing protein [Nanoarchaeota archaeon]
MINITNIGESNITLENITDYYSDSEFSYSASSPTANDTTNGNNEWYLNVVLEANESTVVYLNLTPLTNGTFTNYVNVTTEDIYGNSSFSLDSSSITVNPADDLDFDTYNNSVDCDDNNASIWQNITGYPDDDGDNFGNGSDSTVFCTNGTLPVGEVADNTDCNDDNSSINPNGTEIVNDGIDSTCDGNELCYADYDNDNYGNTTTIASADLDCSDTNESTVSTDCDDYDAAEYPGVTWYADSDGDLFGNASSSSSCDRNVGTDVLNNTDCYDGNSSVNPNATENVADGIDSNCDGSELCYADYDNDNYGNSTTIASGDLDCVDTNESGVSTDCDDYDAAEYPGVTWYADSDGDLFGNASSSSSCDRNVGTDVLNNTDCYDGNSSVNPNATEYVADGIDSNCDGSELCYWDGDNDNYGNSTTTASADLDCADTNESGVSTDCNNANSSINPGAAETVDDGVDFNCDTNELCYVDADDDNYRPNATANTTSADLDCTDTGEAVTSDPTGDCNDANSSINPGATDVPYNGIDEDCSGQDLALETNISVTKTTLTPSILDNGTAQFMINITNIGESNITLENITDYFDSADFDYDSSSPTANDTSTDGEVEWYLGVVLQANESTVVYLNLTPETDGTLNNNVNVTTQDIYGNTSFSQDSSSIEVNSTYVPSVNLTISKTVVNSSVTNGSVVTFILNVTNEGNVNASYYWLEDSYDDSYLTFLDQTSVPYEENNVSENFIGWEFNLTTGNSYVVQINFTGISVGNTTNNATIYNDSDDEISFDDEDVEILLNCTDSDGDGYGVSGGSQCTNPGQIDCNDNNASINPGATEVVNDGIDSTCDGSELCYADYDNDNYGNTTTIASADLDCVDTNESGVSTDCDDYDAAEYPGVTWYADSDGDLFGNASSSSSCERNVGTDVLNNTDCLDTNSSVNPNGTEVVDDGIDSNCDTQEICYFDADDDNYRPNATANITSSDLDCTDSTEAVKSDPTGDCNDANSSINPGATEVCNGIDDDCAGGTDNGLSAPSCTEQDGVCSGSTKTCGGASGWLSCNATNYGVDFESDESTCDTLDNDCDSQTDEGCYTNISITKTTIQSPIWDSGMAQFMINITNIGDANITLENVTDYFTAGEFNYNSSSPTANDTSTDGLVKWYLSVVLQGNESTIVYLNLTPEANGTLYNYVNVTTVDVHGNISFDQASSSVTVNSTPINCTDIDTDGYGINGGTDCTVPGQIDCDDNNASINPNATEIINDGVDMNCDGTELCYADYDNDNYGNTTNISSADLDCADTNESTVSTDCNDNDASVYPGAPETAYDGIDQDCDGQDLTLEVGSTIVKTTVSSPIWHNETAQFVINITNAGESNYTMNNVTDYFTAGEFNYSSSDPAADDTSTDGIVIWNLNVRLTPNESTTIYLNLTPESSGTFTNYVNVSILDQFNNISTANDSAQVVVNYLDVTDPVVNISLPLNNSNVTSHNLAATLSTSFVEDSGNVASAWYTIDSLTDQNTICTSCTSGTANVTFTSYGSHTITVYAQDSSGRNGSNSTTINLVLDTDNDGIPDTNETDADNDGINDTSDLVKGDLDNVNSNLPLINLTINGSDNLSKIFNQTLTVQFTNETDVLVEFEYDFAQNVTLNLANVTIKDTSDNTTGSILISGIDLSSIGETKTVYVPRIDTTINGLCIRDAELASVSQLTSACTGTGEVKIECDGSTQSGYTCTLNATSNRYRITGLTHSVVKQYSYTQPSGTGGSGGGSGAGDKDKCNDKLDNDGDGLIDYPNDPGCISKYDNTEIDCFRDVDCDGGYECKYNTCVPEKKISLPKITYEPEPTCSDNTQNQDETDVDCGGLTCPPCPNGNKCILNTDCTNHCHPSDKICYTFIPETDEPPPVVTKRPIQVEKVATAGIMMAIVALLFVLVFGGGLLVRQIVYSNPHKRAKKKHK